MSLVHYNYNKIGLGSKFSLNKSVVSIKKPFSASTEKPKCKLRLMAVSTKKLAYLSPSLFKDGEELDDCFTGMSDNDGLITIAGYGSLLSEKSARSTFPDLRNFRPAKIVGWRRVFSHTCDIFFRRGIANRETGEISSLSVEPSPGGAVIVSLFEVPSSPEFIASFLDREQEFKFVSVRPQTLDPNGSNAAADALAGSDFVARNLNCLGTNSPFPDVSPLEAIGEDSGRWAVLCARSSDEEYRRRRCTTAAAWDARWGAMGISRIWLDPEDKVLPCRVYTRHCMLAAKRFCPEAEYSFLHHTYLADRKTTLAEHLEQNPKIMEELPPPELAQRYGG